MNKYNKKKLIFKYRKKKNIYIKWINGNHIEKNAKSFKKIMLYIKNKYKKLYGGYCLLKIWNIWGKPLEISRGIYKNVIL